LLIVIESKSLLYVVSPLRTNARSRPGGTAASLGQFQEVDHDFFCLPKIHIGCDSILVVVPVLLTCLLGLYGLIMLVSLLSLYFYHLNLIAINQTTNEVRLLW
jgi:hypothetical protein